MKVDRIQEQLKIVLRVFYDIQKERVSMANRIDSLIFLSECERDESGRPIIKKRDKPATKEEEAAAEKEKESRQKKLLNAMGDFYATHKEAYYKNGTMKSRQKFLSYKDGIIQTVPVWVLYEKYHNLEEEEANLLTVIGNFVQKHYLWTDFLSDIYGCGVLMAAVILTEFNVHEAPHVSCFWAYAGLDVTKDPETGLMVGRSRKKSLMKTMRYINADGEEEERKTLGYNPMLKTKLIGVLAQKMIFFKKKAQEHLKEGQTDYYGEYVRYKERKTKENELKGLGRTKAHINNMAIRYMVKLFLKDLYLFWREREGYELEPDYAEAKIFGRPHIRGKIGDGVAYNNTIKD